MAVVLVQQGPGLTQESYEEVVRRMMDGKTHPESPRDWPVEGLLVHVAGEGENGFRVIDVWDSEESVQRFGETLGPIIKELGIEATPETYPALTFVSATFVPA
ncbi:MAG: hypothetical protein JWO17_316 [Actinomycetia bacterium]|nr:hypothetical protein [Actinomycetes bacterium]